MDLKLEIQKATDKVINEQLPKMVEEKVSKMVDGVLSDLFRSYSDTAELIKSKIEEALDISLVEFGLTDYNTMVSKAIASELDKEIDFKPIKELVKGIIGKSDLKQITISDLCEKVKEISMEENEGQNNEGEISFHINDRQGHGHSCIEISADIEGGKESNRCAVTILVSENYGRIFSMKTNNWRNHNKEFSPSDMVNIDKIENLFFSLYNNQVHIITNDYEDPYLGWARD
ncbi:hypothetical protein V3A08_07395 [Tenacibaculum maritimum]|uniref:hypothetical protein n=1 Tax=Tenacibaculum maritimum TaxID=107401 RepID=UPI0038762AFD